MKKIRTRYAPSPTGYLHIGGARTALFSYLFAKHYGGDFVVRIEDTDCNRNIKDGEKSQLKNLEWLGIIADESPNKPNPQYGPYRQSEKMSRYNDIIKLLISKNLAYKAYDTVEELSLQRQQQIDKGIQSFRYDHKWLQISQEEKARREKENLFAIRLKLKLNFVYEWDDIVRGKIKINTNDIGDFIIQRQSGEPTYNLSVVVDDHDMQISHVLRGEEHITNTPKQLAIYDALNWKAPQFGHLTIITNMEGKKLSKRDLQLKQFIENYKNEGYIPHAIFNFLALLGWTHPQAQEKMSQKQIIKDFDPQRFSKSPSKFDIKKMNWFAKSYISELDNNFFQKHINFHNKEEHWIQLFLTTYKKSVVSIQELKKQLKIYDNMSIQKTNDSDVVKVFANQLKNNDFTPQGINQAILNTQKITNAKGKQLYLPIRLATTYQEHGPELAVAIYLFGENIIKRRLY